MTSERLTFDLCFSLFGISYCNSIVITTVTPGVVAPSGTKDIIESNLKSNTKIKYDSRIIREIVPFNELTEIMFIKILMLNLRIGSLNTILFQYSNYSSFTNLMLGPQQGIVIKDKHDISYYRKLFEYYCEKLEIIMSLYNTTLPEFIVIYLKEIIINSNIKKGRLSKIALPKRLINVSEAKNNFNSNILPLTLDEKYFGYLLESSIKSEYLNKLINNLQNNILLYNNEYNKSLLNIKINLHNNDFLLKLKSEKIQIAFLKEVIGSVEDKFKVYLSENKLYLIISYLSNKFEYIRIVYHIKTGKFLLCCKDLLNNDNLVFLNKDTNKHFVRECGNISIALNKNNDIDLFIKKIDLPFIKYETYKKNIKEEFHLNNSKKKSWNPIPIRNPKFGVFDIETFNDVACEGGRLTNYSRVYAIGYCIHMGEPSMFYLTDFFDNTEASSNKLVIKCIDAMLKQDYHNYIFYVHNFGKFDAIFLHKILLDYNLTQVEFPEKQYRLVPLYRDSKMIRFDVIKTINKKVIKISFFDSINILENSLEKLCSDFGVSTTKGIFPYRFVNKDNLEYIGPIPDISFYNKNVNMDIYNESIVPNWSLKKETLKYLERDLISLLEVLENFQALLWEDHNIELTANLTISGLAKTKFLKYYLKDSKIPLINTNNLFQFIYSSYFGGITEVYKPYGENLTYLDVNSLYPFAALNPMPGIKCK